jgi:hypothetical protein
VQSRPARDAGEHESSRSRGDEPRQERTTQRSRWNLSRCSSHLEEEERRDERAAEQRRDRRECACQHEELALVARHAEEADGDCAENETDSDERCLRAEHEPEREGRKRREQDAAEVDWPYVAHPQPGEW